MYMEQEVQTGIELLDKHDPGWDGRINLDTLNVASPSQCVLGQTQGTYIVGLAKLNLGLLDISKYGFTTHIVQRGSLDNAGDAFRMLTETWKTKIVERRAGKQPAISQPVQERELVLA